MRQVNLKSVTGLDLLVCQKIYSWNGKKTIDRFFYGLSKTGDGYLYGVIGLFLIYVHSNLALKILGAGLIAFSIELSLHLLLKKSTKRSRPFEKIEGIHHLIKPPDKFSFPSGHTAAAFLMAILLSQLFPQFTIPLYLWASLVGFSRVYLGVHFPTDVIAGMALGLVSGKIGITLIF